MSWAASEVGGSRDTWKRRFGRIDETVGAFTRVISAGGAIAACVIMIVMTVDVLYRNAIGRSVPGAFEIVEVALVLAIFLGMAGAERNKVHVRVTLITDAVPLRIGEAMRIFGLVVSLGIALWFTVSTFDKAMVSFHSGEYKTGLISFPIWPGRLLISPVPESTLMFPW